MSKGSRQRPTDKEKFDAAWDRIFKQNSVKSTSNQPTGEDHANVQRQEEERREVISFDDIVRAAAIMDSQALTGDFAVQCTDPGGIRSMVFLGTLEECTAVFNEMTKDGIDDTGGK
jgi:hypothetical protein